MKTRSTAPHRARGPETSTHSATPAPAPAAGQVPWRSIVVVAVTAAFCASLAWTVVGPLSGVAMEVHNQGGSGTREVGVLAVIVSSLLIALAGGALLRWWQGRSPTGTRRWTIVALVVTLLSVLGPASAVTFADGMALLSLHGVVAAVVIVGLTRSRRC